MKKTMTFRVVKIYKNYDMRCRRDGAEDLLGTEITNLKSGEYVACVNTKENLLRFFTAHRIMIDYKAEEGRFILLEAIKYMPQYLGASGGDVKSSYKQAVEECLKEKFSTFYKKRATAKKKKEAARAKAEERASKRKPARSAKESRKAVVRRRKPTKK